MSGCFITFEGVEGCGKSTQIALLAEHLRGAGHEVVVTREPGGTPVAEAIRDVLLDPAHTGMGAMAELLLYEAARAQHVHERIQPALDAGQVVLCDRFADSTTAYQGAGRGIDPAVLRDLHRVATGGVWPACTLLIDLPVETGLERARGRGRKDRMEQESLEFHRRVRAGFLALADLEPGRIQVIDGTQPIEAVHKAVRRAVEAVLPSPVE